MHEDEAYEAFSRKLGSVIGTVLTTLLFGAIAIGLLVSFFTES